MAIVLLSACAGLPGREPVNVTVADVVSLPGEGMEARLLLKLRVQNPNDAALDYDGISLSLDVQGKAFATGVSDKRGTIPRFGEAVIEIPVTVSTWRLASRVFGFMREGSVPSRLDYTLRGRFGGPLGMRGFESSGVLSLPGFE